MGNLVSLGYWFNSNPGPWLEGNLRIVYAVFGLMIIGGMIAWWFVIKNKDNKLMSKFWQKLQNALLTIGVAGLLLIFSRQQRISVLAMPFLFILLLIGAGVWAYFIFRYVTKTMPQKKQEMENKKSKEKYLP